jgi:hypothetical protein
MDGGMFVSIVPFIGNNPPLEFPEFSFVLDLPHL